MGGLNYYGEIFPLFPTGGWAEGQAGVGNFGVGMDWKEGRARFGSSLKPVGALETVQSDVVADNKVNRLSQGFLSKSLR